MHSSHDLRLVHGCHRHTRMAPEGVQCRREHPKTLPQIVKVDKVFPQVPQYRNCRLTPNHDKGSRTLTRSSCRARSVGSLEAGCGPTLPSCRNGKVRRLQLREASRTCTLSARQWLTAFFQTWQPQIWADKDSRRPISRESP